MTEGFEDTLYGVGEIRLPKFLVTADLVEGVEEETKQNGEVAKTPDNANVMEAVKRLLDRGARIIVISLHNAHFNRHNERKIKEIINSHYPKHYLGSLPVILASEFCNHPDEAGRTNLAILNAYVHPKVSQTLYHAEDRLREYGYSKPLLVVDSSGGCSRVAKTKAVDIIGSSPVAVYVGSKYWAKKYNIPNVVIIDLGGTSCDIGIIVDGETIYGHERKLFNLPMATPVLEVNSIGLGGGSIAKADLEMKSIEVGPESAGALPGPACYDLGGDDPTLTDSDVILKRIDPEYFLGGRKKLNSEKAHEATQNLVADPLGLSPEEAALKVVEKAAELAASEIKEMLDRLGKSASDFVLFACGGAGPTHCCDIVERLSISKIYTFPFSATFGAFGTSMMNVTHTYMRYKSLPLIKEGTIVLDMEGFNKIVTEEQENGFRDMIGEGFTREDIKWALELEISEAEDHHRTLMSSPKVELKSIADGEAILETYEGERARLGKQQQASKNAQIEVFYLKSYCPLFKYEFPKNIVGDSDPSRALKTERPALGRRWPRKVKVYDLELLKCGNVVEGVAILESTDTTYIIPKGWMFKVDEYRNGVIERLE